MSGRLSLIGALAAALLSSCSAGTLYNQHFAQSYQFLELMAFHGGKDMRIIVQGDPYGVGSDSLAAFVGTAMSGRNEGLPIRFTPNPETAAGAPGRLEILFHPGSNALGVRLCRGETKPVGDGIADQALIVYCKRDRDLSSLWLKLPKGTKPGDQDFDDAFALAIRELLPRDPPIDRGDRCRTCLAGTPEWFRR